MNRRFDPPKPTAPAKDAAAKGAAPRLDPAAQRLADMLMRDLLDERALDLRKAPLGGAVNTIARVARHLCDSSDPDDRSVGYALHRAIAEGRPEDALWRLGFVRPGGGKGGAAGAHLRLRRDRLLVHLWRTTPEWRNLDPHPCARQMLASHDGFLTRGWRYDRDGWLPALDPMAPSQPSRLHRFWRWFLSEGMRMPRSATKIAEILRRGVSSEKSNLQ